MEHLLEKLARNGESDIYPCHMPGHKRSCWGEFPQQLFQLDITEIEGFDNLHQPEGILLRLQKKAAALCGARESFYLVNGSTCGILSAVSAALPAGGHILMARNCHKSAYHAAYLRDLEISYIYPNILGSHHILEAVAPEQVRKALERERDIGAVLVVSPTYEGRIADIADIAGVVHERGIPLIVDEAHGAHLGLSSSVQENSCRQGADLVVQSVHKTLPALTQTALLHVNGDLVDGELLRRFLRVYQTSSPSYLLLASIDNALHYMEKNGETAFAEFREQYMKMLDTLAGCRVLKFLPADSRQDLGKLLIFVGDAEVSGKRLYDILLHRYGIQAEMAAESFVLAMFTVNDRPEGYERMTRALLEIDAGLEGKNSEKTKSGECELWAQRQDRDGGMRAAKRGSGSCSLWTAEQNTEESGLWTATAGRWTAECKLAAAWDGRKEEVVLEECAGRLAGEFVNLYPPGVPLIVPGERISSELCEQIGAWLRQGLSVQGGRLKEGRYLLSVLKKA